MCDLPLLSMTKSQTLAQLVIVGMRLLPGKSGNECYFSPSPGITSLYFAAPSRLVPGSSEWVQKRKVEVVGNFLSYDLEVWAELS